MGARARTVDVVGRILVAWTAFWLLLAALLISLDSVLHPNDFLSGEAGAGVKALGYVLSAAIVAALVVAVWDGMARTGGGRLTATLCVAVYVLAVLVTALDPGADDPVAEIAAVGAFTLGGGVVGGLLRARAADARPQVGT